MCKFIKKLNENYISIDTLIKLCVLLDYILFNR